MAKFCNNCGAQLSDEMIFCNKCGAKYREGQAVQEPAYTATPVQTTATYSTPVTPAAGASVPRNRMWYVALIMSLVSVLILAFAPILKSDGEVTYTSWNGSEATEDLGSEDAESVFEICDTDDAPTKAQLGMMGEEIANIIEDAIDSLETGKTFAIIAIIAGAVGIIVLIAFLANKITNPAVCYGAAVAQVVVIGATLLIAFSYVKNACEDLAKSIYGADASVDVSIKFGVWGWLLLLAGAVAIFATIKGIQSTKHTAVNSGTATKAY